jgi:hypothetical protein
MVPATELQCVAPLAKMVVSALLQTPVTALALGL